MINSRLIDFLNVPLGEGAHTVTYLHSCKEFAPFLVIFVKIHVSWFCGKEHRDWEWWQMQFSYCMQGSSKGRREVTIWNLRVMTRQPRSNDLKSKGCTPQYECEGCKVGLVTVPRVNQECRLPGKSLVRRQVQGQTCRIKSVGDGQDPDRWDACPDKGTAAILAELRWRPHQRAADSRVKKWTCALTLLLAFPQRVPRPDKVSQTEFFYQRIRIEQGAKLEPVGKYRPVPDSDT